ncbi:MAG: hypothetical protein JXR31_09675 [Prolixibacteraceae bacterium]|nr:hypothetical protein [Prolixibacteraceae bacterium]MBN2774504.1 hypothetical protein [Prolixibacteraceae bacterium]
MKKERDNIEKIILENLEKLNDREPMEGHLARFEEKLKKQNRKNRPGLRIVLRVAAAAVFIFLAVNQAIIYLSPDKKDTITTLSQISPEYKEVEFYYTSSIEEGLNQWQQFDNAGLLTEEDKLLMNEELKDFEVLLNDLKEDLNTHPDDERVINAMLEYYQNKLNIINLIICKLEEVKNLKETNHEIEI